MNNEKEGDKFCGECCWFYAEDTDGWGQCLRQKLCDSMNCSDLCTTDEYVNRKEMRHHMAVLLQAERWYSAINDPKNYNIVYVPNPTEYRKAIRFAYKYMKVFSQL